MYPEVSTSQPAGSIKSVLLVGYRFPGYKIIIKGLFHKFIFTKKKIIKSWRHALKIWKEVFSCVHIINIINTKQKMSSAKYLQMYGSPVYFIND